MKKLFRTLMVLSIASVAVLSSCKKDEDVAAVKVTVTASPSDASLTIGTPLKLTIQCEGNDDNKLKMLKVASTSASLLSKELSGTTHTEVVDITLSKIGTNVFTITLSGEEGDDAVTSYTVTVTAPTNFKQIFGNSSPIPLGAQLNGSLGQLIDLSTGEVFTYGSGQDSTSSALIDLCYASGSNKGPSLFAPTNADFVTGASGTVYSRFKNYPVRNATKLVKLSGTMTEAQFDAITNDSLVIVNNPTADLANNLAVGEVVAFKLAKNPEKTGLIWIKSLTTGSNGSIDIKLKASN